MSHACFIGSRLFNLQKRYSFLVAHTQTGKTIHVIICEFSSGLMLNSNVGSPSTHSVFVSRHILNCTADVQNASLIQFYSALQIYHRNNAMVMQNNSLSALCFTSDRLIERHSKCL